MNYTFVNYCINGNIEGIRNMSLKKCNLDEGLVWACGKGHYDIVLYLNELYKKGKLIENYYYMKDFHSIGFIDACCNGHYMIVKYLVESYKTVDLENDPDYKMININSLNEGFRYACEYGHYIIVKYLVELYKNDENYEKINIHLWNDRGFNYACRNKHYMIVKYLMMLYKKHKYNPLNYYLRIFNKFNKFMFH